MVGDMLSGIRSLSADVLRAARERLSINPDWLLGYNGPRYTFDVLTEGTFEEMLGVQVLAKFAARLEAAPLKGCGIAPTCGPLELDVSAGVQLVDFVVDTAASA